MANPTGNRREHRSSYNTASQWTLQRLTISNTSIVRALIEAFKEKLVENPPFDQDCPSKGDCPYAQETIQRNAHSSGLDRRGHCCFPRCAIHADVYTTPTRPHEDRCLGTFSLKARKPIQRTTCLRRLSLATRLSSPAPGNT